MTSSVLVVAAHPDDEILGCGGAMARWRDEGIAVRIAILGEGITSRDGDETADRRALTELKANAARAARVVGCDEPEFFDLPDNRFDTIPLLSVTKTIEDLVQRHRPDHVVTQHGGDLNIDHEITFRATLTATRPMAGCCVRQVWAYEVPSSTEWAFGAFSPSFRPNVFVDVSDSVDRKVEAMACYVGESRVFPHPRSGEALRAAAVRHGSSVGCAAAEAFEVVRAVY